MRSEFLAENLSSATSASLLAGRVARIHTSVPIKILGRYVIFRNLPCTDLGNRVSGISSIPSTARVSVTAHRRRVLSRFPESDSALSGSP
jgi:hypothetical protein